jgi:dTDP-4-dehydrorhamnose reductase
VKNTILFFVAYPRTLFLMGENGPYAEEAEANPISIYGERKLKAEQLLQASSIRWAIARTVLVYGNCGGH